MEDEPELIAERGLLAVSDDVWSLAVRRAAVIGPLLEQVQMDHTEVDLVVVDERHRLPIGRPYVTVGIDVQPLHRGDGRHAGG